ncbi:MAG: hypothetical protein COV91_05045 [Candidatus Taylorbacteria bacterium CG11_big_fil_rev_8_21_14_0_20_46_11]|uniref:RiboL-PSP-HEPN domain-containing protein n=1 Tax=Candidatus Taylorbacteria bacterium CG11_big_fil_rev_8_21_14_0_20_46_11 TaxID=1975025 RepID=A0A2H0KAJ8_9BACT|nr:MAG: hypothetical protein COV91_05045 [Candidatus Taylorbacteria bacterium CG11_big_fil_rev_8_21_14_0_20_46_11]
MKESNFAFVENEVFRQNLDEAFDHITTLLPFTESVTYNEAAKSAFCKTIIIYTALIVEALLFYVLDKKFTESDIEDFYTSWELKNMKVLYSVNDSHQIVAGDYSRILGKTGKEKMNLGQIIDFLKAKKAIDSGLFVRLDVIRKLRNEQHIGTHKKVRVYSKKDITDAFSIARDVKKFVQKGI